MGSAPMWMKTRGRRELSSRAVAGQRSSWSNLQIAITTCASLVPHRKQKGGHQQPPWRKRRQQQQQQQQRWRRRRRPQSLQARRTHLRQRLSLSERSWVLRSALKLTKTRGRRELSSYAALEQRSSWSHLQIAITTCASLFLHRKQTRGHKQPPWRKR